MKQIRNVSGYTILGLCFAGIAYGSGGWVGNSPLQAAFEPSIRTAPDWEKEVINLSPTSPDPNEVDNKSLIHPQATPTPVVADLSEVEPVSYNSLLLPEGVSRLTIGHLIGSGDTMPILGFDYGISDKWTLRNLTALGYSLRARNGRGHELALLMGLPQGLEYTSSTGFVIGPGLGLQHAFTSESGRWRFTNSLFVSGSYGFGERGGWRSATLRLRSGVNYWFGEKWAAGFSTESALGHRTVTQLLFNGEWSSSEQKESFTKLFFHNPILTISRRLGSQGILTIGTGYLGDNLNSISRNGGTLSFTTEW